MDLSTRPKATTNAVRLLYLILIVGFILGVINILTSGSMATLEQAQHTAHSPILQNPRLFAFSIQIVAVLILLWLIVKISHGRNWARITYLIFFVLGLIGIIQKYLMTPTQPMLIQAWDIIACLLQLVALVLLFTKDSNQWFRSKKITD